MTARSRGTGPAGVMVVATAFVLVVAACSDAAGAAAPAGAGAPGAGAPAGVYGPAPTSSTSAATSPDPSPSPGADRGWAAGPLPPSAAPTAIVSLLIKARNIRFDTDHLEAPAGRAFVLEFDNDDPGIPHNVDINDATGASVFKGAIHTGPSEALYEVPALAAGSYTFHCDVHPTMRGTLTVN